jgi:hypothetical protein
VDGTTAETMKSIEQAREGLGGVAILSGRDDATFLIAPMSIVRIGDQDLKKLADDLAKVHRGFPFASTEEVRVSYRFGSAAELGESSKDRGVVERGIWINRDLMNLGLGAAAREVLTGAREHLPLRRAWPRTVVYVTALMTALAVGGSFDIDNSWLDVLVFFAVGAPILLALEWLGTRVIRAITSSL